ncbi:(-)-isopiperitenol/(-)-carveol dehydrogenase, mitochondrial [Cyphellophora attinorum]|uniref:(-)-isopiperitenol/(-)-carveol dehydrogenase, mitochondrial n=1 Tax=Cyphellophora attinorum TaxID=1664694 RepID=A0A0N1GWS6_9EURO|nr:(-)-isopiperitenol/(-)-carveol dehydrogenase, mitochondrial [Phialophora attinorum]KPI34450.1 (-)-isopiperitenol/(-)-carveol dehydrogenase, mitochondrial [Phialophora attinorum]
MSSVASAPLPTTNGIHDSHTASVKPSVMVHSEVDTQLVQKLQGKVVVVTGGSSGIGLATLNLFAAKGALIVNGDIQPPPDFDGKGSSSITHEKTDVTKWADLCSLFEKAKTLHGRVDHVFANAGIAPGDTYMSLQVDDRGQLLEPSHLVMDVNLKALVNTVALAVHHIRPRARDDVGSIVITASESSYQRYLPTEYAVSKHGALGLIRAMHANVRHHDLSIRVNGIMPSWTATGMVPVELMDALGFPWQPAEAVASAVGLLMADESRDGQVLYVAKGNIKEVDEAILLKAACQVQDVDRLTANEEYLKLIAAIANDMEWNRCSACAGDFEYGYPQGKKCPRCGKGVVRWAKANLVVSGKSGNKDQDQAKPVFEGETSRRRIANIKPPTDVALATSTKASQQSTPAPRPGGLIFDPVTQLSTYATDRNQDNMRYSTDAGQEGGRAEGLDDAIAADAIRVLVERFRAHEETIRARNVEIRAHQETIRARDVEIRAHQEMIRARDVEIRALQEDNRALKKRKIGEA